MCFDICTINIRVSIRVRGLHLVSFTFNGLIQPAFLMVRTIFMIGKTPVWVVKTFSPNFDVLTCLNPMFVLDDSTCNN